MDSSTRAALDFSSVDFGELPHFQRQLVGLSDVELGHGAFGVVFEGTLGTAEGDTVRIAIKTPRSKFSSDERDKLLFEGKIINKLNHPNIIKLLGVCQENNTLLLLFELMERGNLLSYLRSSRPTQNSHSSITFGSLVKMATDVVSGCEYLEGQEGIHCDIAARNCLVSATGVVKLADFGLSHDVHEKGYYRFGDGSRLSYRWMAPETTLDKPFTTKSDVWSFGVLFWEMVTLGEEPYKGLSAHGVFTFIQAGQRLEIPRYCPKDLCDIINSCWRIEPATRLSFSALHTRLLKLLSDEAMAHDAPFPPHFIETININAALHVVTAGNCASAATSLKNGYASIKNLRAPGWRLNCQPVTGSIPGYLSPSPEEAIRALRTKLAINYQTYARISIFANLDPVPIDELFVELEFKTSKGLVIDKYQAALEPFLRFDSTRKLFVIWGQPGQGKTTLVKKICYDWSRMVTQGVIDHTNDYIKDVELLLVCSLRNVRESFENILEMCVSRPEDVPTLRCWLKTSSSRFLVILDGFDELQPYERCTELHSIFFNVAPIFVPPFPLIVTSRPVALHNAKLDFSGELRGIVGKEIYNFVQKYYPKNGDKIFRYLEKNVQVKERLFKSPLLLAMLCALVEGSASYSEERSQLPKTQTELYVQMCNWLVGVEMSKKPSSGTVKCDADNENLFHSLAQLAFEKTVCDDSRLIFDDEELKGNHFQIDVETATRIGFLTSDGMKTSNGRPLLNPLTKSPPRRFAFLHRTFQEFFAASFASENPLLFCKFFDTMEFKSFLPDQFVIFLSGFIVDDKSKAFDVLLLCLKAKRDFAVEDYSKTAFVLKQRRKRFPTAVGIDQRHSSVGYVEEYFNPLFVQIYDEIESNEIRDALLTRVLFADESKGGGFYVSLLQALFAAAEKFDLPRGWGFTGCLISVDRLFFRFAVLLKPIDTVLLTQRKENCNEGSGEQSRFRVLDALPQETLSFYFTGEADAFLVFLPMTEFKIRVTEMCRLTFSAKDAKGEDEQRVLLHVPSSLSASACRIEIADGGFLRLVCEERLNNAQWTKISQSILAKKLEWLNILCRWDSSSSSSWQTKIATVHSLQMESTSWTTTNYLQINSLDFRTSVADVGLNNFFASIEVEETIFLNDCILPSDQVSTFLPLRWRRPSATWKALVFTACTSSSDASIFEEAGKIVATLPRLENLQFDACDFPPDADAAIDAFCAKLEEGGHCLRHIFFTNCGNLNPSQLARLKTFGDRLHTLDFIDIDDILIHKSKICMRRTAENPHAPTGARPSFLDKLFRRLSH